MPKLSLKALRVNKGLTQEQACVELKIAKKTLWSWENGKSFPDQPEIDRICKLYGVRYDEIRF